MGFRVTYIAKAASCIVLLNYSFSSIDTATKYMEEMFMIVLEEEL